MADTLIAGEIGRLAAATSVSGTDKFPVYQSGVLRSATANQIASGADAVDGPSSATDNAVARFDGTTGKLIQNSAVTIADTTGDISCGAITQSGSTTYSAAARTIILKQGSNGKTGTFTANGATPVSVSNTSITANSGIIFTLKTVGGTVGAYPAIQTITASTGFTVACTALDTSVYNYHIIESAA